MDQEQLSRLRRKYGKESYPEPKEYTPDELEKFLLEQNKMELEAIEKSNRNDERLSRRRINWPKRPTS